MQKFSEEIAGHHADLWRNRIGRKYFTGAEWSSPKVWFEGDAEDLATADLEIAVYRTVRFDAK